MCGWVWGQKPGTVSLDLKKHSWWPVSLTEEKHFKGKPRLEVRGLPVPGQLQLGTNQTKAIHVSWGNGYSCQVLLVTNQPTMLTWWGQEGYDLYQMPFVNQCEKPCYPSSIWWFLSHSTIWLTDYPNPPHLWDVLAICRHKLLAALYFYLFPVSIKATTGIWYIFTYDHSSFRSWELPFNDWRNHSSAANKFNKI